MFLDEDKNALACYDHWSRTFVYAFEQNKPMSHLNMICINILCLLDYFPEEVDRVDIWKETKQDLQNGDLDHIAAGYIPHLHRGSSSRSE